MFRSNFQEERPEPDSKLQAVFSKLTGVFPKAGDLGNGAGPKTMSSDIIESVLADTPIPIPQNWGYDCYPNSEDDSTAVAITALSQRLESELRAAKRTHLSCGEVLLPCGLLQRIACDMIAMAESEPCGLRGCTLFLHFEGESNTLMKLSTVKCDPLTASTFELDLTLKQSTTGWNSFLPQFIKNLTRGGTVMISPAYTLNQTDSGQFPCQNYCTLSITGAVLKTERGDEGGKALDSHSGCVGSMSACPDSGFPRLLRQMLE